jgi:hypothetical protein
MHQELLMHVASAHVQDRIRFADQQRVARTAQAESKAATVKARRGFRWAFNRTPAQSASPSH